jgi:hypothetical protein
MVKKFVLPCNFSGQTMNIDFFIGNPHADTRPINFQAKWLGENQGGSVPQRIMDSIQKIKMIADREKVSFEDLCLYTVNLANGIEQEGNKQFDHLLIENDKKEQAERRMKEEKNGIENKAVEETVNEEFEEIVNGQTEEKVTEK